MQLEFRKSWLIPGTLLALGVLLFREALNQVPNRAELGRRSVPLRFQPVAIGPGSSPLFRVVGAWRLLVDDPRFGGLSALAVERTGLVALTDSGVVVHFPRPDSANRQALVQELPDGPGAPGFKVNRDSEALQADPSGRGWWVAFENRNEIWLYDLTFAAALSHVPAGIRGLRRNRGIEGMIAHGSGLILFPERGGRAIALGRKESISLDGISGWLSDAATLPDGRVAVLNRQPTPIGLRNSIVTLERRGSGYRSGQAWPIPLGRLDNVEGLAAEPLPGGATRLWLVTDNNFQRRRPTLLIAVDLKPRPARR